jgi:serine/threonine protein kinase
MMAPVVSEQVGSYQLLDEIESEGLVALYDATDPLTGRELLLRLVRLPEDVREDMLPIFEREAAAAAQLTHPCIVPIVDHGVEAGAPYVVFDRTDAISLVELRRRAGGRVDPQTAAIVALDVAKALEHAHAHRPPIIHRGLAPHRIQVDADGHAQLGGYALTGLLAAVSSVYSQVLELVAQYQSPELLKGREVTPAADMFSLGSTFYELLAGRSAFEAPSPLAATLKISMGSFERLDRAAPEVPADLRDLVHALLSAQPAARPTASDLVTELTSFVGRSEQRRQALGQLVRPTPAPSVAAAPVVPAVSMPLEDELLGLDDRTDQNRLNSGLEASPIAAPPPALRAPARPLPLGAGLIEGVDDSPTKEVALPEPYPVGPSFSPDDLVGFGDLEEERTVIDHEGVEKTVQIHAPQARALLDSLPSSAPVDEAAWMEKTVQIANPVAGSPRLEAREQVAAPPRHLPRQSLPDIGVAPLAPLPPPPATPQPGAPPARASRGGFDPSIAFFVALGFGAVGLVVVVAILTAWLASG